MNNKSMWLIRTVGVLLMIVVLFGVIRTNAQESEPNIPVTDNVPNEILAPSSLLFSYQGQLLDANDNPINNTSVPMTFKIYSVPTGGTACWTEVHSGANAVNVESGLFNVLLGQITTINTSCLTGNAFLELIVNGETLTPRERFTSVVHAVESSSLSAGSTIYGDVSIQGNIDMHENSIGQVSEVMVLNPNNTSASFRLGWLNDTARIRVGGDGAGSSNGFDIQGSGNSSLFRVDGSGNSQVPGNLSVSGEITVETIVGVSNLYGSGWQQLYMPSDGNMYVNWFAGSGVFFGGGDQIMDVQIDNNGINMHGNSITNCGALVEANLQTQEELDAGYIDRFEEGDVLCWGVDQLELCTLANDRLVQAVADPQGRPIIIGAEVIKVLGTVKAGDILVSSDVPGYAIVNNDPLPGTVIAQALEDFEGEFGVIKAMIRKW